MPSCLLWSPGFGPYSLRRANITWRQEVGGSIEASSIVGNANTKITEEYTIVQLNRQDGLTRRIQGRRAKAGKKANEVLQMKKSRRGRRPEIVSPHFRNAKRRAMSAARHGGSERSRQGGYYHTLSILHSALRMARKRDGLGDRRSIDS